MPGKSEDWHKKKWLLEWHAGKSEKDPFAVHDSCLDKTGKWLIKIQVSQYIGSFSIFVNTSTGNFR